MKKLHVVVLSLLFTLFFGFTNSSYLEDVSNPALVKFKNITDQDYTCSGIFISESVILTAAHCLESDFDDEAEKKNKIKDLKIKISNGSNAQIQDYKIHPLYDYYHFADIALIKVNYKSKFFKSIASRKKTTLVYKGKIEKITTRKDSPETLVTKNETYLFNVKIFGSFLENTYLHSGTPLYVEDEVVGIAREFNTSEIGFFDPTETLYVNVNHSDIKRFISKTLEIFIK